MDAADRSSLPRRLVNPKPREPLPTTVDELPALDSSFSALIDAGLAAIPLDLSDGARRALDDHVRLLLAWNAHINLSGLRTPDEIARGHVLDALIAVPALRTLSDATRPTVLDLGSGGGFPGLPLAVAMPARRVALVDSVAKKAAFLEAAARVVSQALAASGEEPGDFVVLAERAEDLADEPEQRETWDLVVARAVGSVAEVAELGLPLARPGGHVVAWKRAGGSADLAREIEAASRVSADAGGGRPRQVVLEAAGWVGLDGNCLVVIEKLRPTPDRYPRSAGERRRAALP